MEPQALPDPITGVAAAAAEPGTWQGTMTGRPSGPGGSATGPGSSA